MASLLDFLSPNGDNGGLIDFLRNNSQAAVNTQATGAPGDAADYSGNGGTIQAPQINYTAPQPQPAAPIAAPAQPAGGGGLLSALSSVFGGGGNAQPTPAPSPITRAPLPAPAPAAAPAAPAPAPPQAPQASAPIFGGGAPMKTNVFGQSQAGPLSTGLQNFARILGNVPRGGMDAPEVIAQRQADANLATQSAQRNQTAAALVSKGADKDIAAAAVLPGNTEMLKTMVDQYLGPAKAPSMLGEGWGWDPNTETVKRIYAPEGKIPIGFQKDKDGNLAPIPNGPSDPKYIAAAAAAKSAGKSPTGLETLGKGAEIIKKNEDGTVTVVHKNDEGGKALSDETATSIAAQWLSGNHEVTRNLPKAAVVQIREAVTKQAKDAGMNENDINDAFNEQNAAKSSARTAGEMGAKVAVKAGEAYNMIKIARDASKEVPRGEWVPLNKVYRMIATNNSNPKQKAFVSSVNSLVNAYASAISNGTPTDSQREHAHEILDTADGPEAFEAGLATMEKELEGAKEAPKHAIKSLRTGTGNRVGQPVEAAPGSGATYTVGDQKYTVKEN